MVRLKPLELQILQYLAEQLQAGKTMIAREAVMSRFSIDQRTFDNAIAQLEVAHAFREVYKIKSDTGVQISAISLDNNIIQMVREYEAVEKAAAAAKPDFVDQIKTRFHTNPAAAWVIVIIAGAIVVLTLFNQLGDAIERISRWFTAPAASSAPPPSPAIDHPSGSSPDPHPPSLPPGTH